MKTSTFAQTSLGGRILVAVAITAVLVTAGVGVARAGVVGAPEGVASSSVGTTGDHGGAKSAPATLEEVIKDAKETTFYDTDQFLWEHYGMTEREFERTYGVDDDVLDPYEAPKPSAAQSGDAAAGGSAPHDNAFATRQEYEAAKDAWKAAHPGVDDDVWESQHPNPFDFDDHDDHDD